MDHDTLLALRLQFEEIEIAKAHYDARGKHARGSRSDFDIAVDDFNYQLTALDRCIADQRLAVSIAKACATDTTAIAEALSEERVAQLDHQAAVRLEVQLNEEVEQEREAPEVIREPPLQHRQPIAVAHASRSTHFPAPGPVIRQPVPQRYYSRELDNLSLDGISDDDIGYGGGGGSTTSYDDYQRKAETFFTHSPRVQCGACLEKVIESLVIRTPCGHRYCRICLKSIITRSITDESLYPPRCCTIPIPESTVEKLLTDEELTDYRDSEAEFTAEDRVYCTKRTCGKFIPPSCIEESGAARCNRCGTAVCVHCKNAFHLGDCPEDEGLGKVVSLGEVKKWKRCYKCRTMVELDTGCNHITCKCKAEFCYVCGIPWKQCDCPTWDEPNLLRRAEDVVDRDAANPLPANVRRQRVQNMAERMEPNVACRHTGQFQKVQGRGGRIFVCELCGTGHRLFGYVCTQCRVMTCRECMRFRN